MRRPPTDLARWLREAVELPTLIVVLVLVAAAWGFAAIAGEVLEGDTRAFDQWAVEGLRDAAEPARPRGPEWLVKAARDITALGGVTVLALVTLAAAVFLLLWGRLRGGVLVVVAGGGGLLVNHLLKGVFARPRPDVVPHLVEVSSLSFPSGHAMASAAVYLSLAVLLARVFDRRLLKLYVLGSAVLLILLVGATRVYLGVHYPTDVLAGWLAGAAWALLCDLAVLWLQRRGAVEPPSISLEPREE